MLVAREVGGLCRAEAFAGCSLPSPVLPERCRRQRRSLKEGFPCFRTGLGESCGMPWLQVSWVWPRLPVGL